MLYCPKCKRSYPELSQRFCSNDGGRLVPMPDSSKSNQASADGIFTNLLEKSGEKSGANYDSDEKLADFPRLRYPKSPISIRTKLDDLDLDQQNPISKALTFEPEEIEIPKKSETKATKETEEALPKAVNVSVTKPDLHLSEPIFRTSEGQNPRQSPRVINQYEIPESQALLGNREKNPTGRLAISSNNPDVLLGQTVKGRYYVEEKLGQDASGINFVASDKISIGKKVVIRVLLDDAEASNPKLAEERVSLSHMNHPHIASLIDSGELLEGKQFLVTEYIEGKRLRELMNSDVQINELRAGRIVRQIGYALSDAHHNGVLHRNLRPESVMLGVSEVGAENVKVTDFCDSSSQNLRSQSLEKISYWSPEQIEGNAFGYSSDVFSLAVIAYQMLTGKHPFSFDSAKTLLDAQKKQLSLDPRSLSPNLPDGIDEVIARGLKYEPNERYPRARDFGEALFNVLNSKSINLREFSTVDTNEPNATEVAEVSSKPLIDNNLLSAVNSDKYLHIASNRSLSDVKLTSDLETDKIATDPNLWAKRSPEPPKVISIKWLLAALLGTLLIIAAAAATWTYYYRTYTEQEVQKTQPVVQSEPSNTPTESNKSTEVVNDLEYSPSQRTIDPPEGFSYFQNTKQEVSTPALLKKFRGFSLYFPSDWTKGMPDKSSTFFVDVKKSTPSGLPIEQVIVEPYPSNGTYKEDAAEFPKLVSLAEKELKASPNYQKLDERETIINGRKVYEVRWVIAGDTKAKEVITIWGRTMFMPAQHRGIKNGLRITVIASSLSTEVKSIEDVATKGNLKKIIDTFEPDPIN
jgi:serine/threonine protein kinase